MFGITNLAKKLFTRLNTKNAGGDNKEIELLALRAGLALLACSLVENNLQKLLQLEEISWLDRPPERRMLRSGVNKLKNIYRLNKGLSELFDEFVDCRNRLVHGIWNISDHRLNTSEGRRAAYVFAAKTHVLASRINSLLWPALEDAYKRKVEDASTIDRIVLDRS